MQVVLYLTISKLTAQSEQHCTYLHRQIASQTSIMMAAGYETTATTLAFSILLLGRHPHAQQRLLQEVDAFKVS